MLDQAHKDAKASRDSAMSAESTPEKKGKTVADAQDKHEELYDQAISEIILNRQGWRYSHLQEMRETTRWRLMYHLRKFSAGN